MEMGLCSGRVVVEEEPLLRLAPAAAKKARKQSEAAASAAALAAKKAAPTASLALVMSALGSDGSLGKLGSKSLRRSWTSTGTLPIPTSGACAQYTRGEGPPTWSCSVTIVIALFVISLQKTARSGGLKETPSHSHIQ